MGTVGFLAPILYIYFNWAYTQGNSGYSEIVNIEGL